MKLNAVLCGNHDVADHYYRVIANGAEKAGYQVNYLNSLDDVFCLPKNEHYLVGTVVEAFKLYIRGYHNICVWVQGILPEESFLRNKKKFNMYVLEIIERYILARAKFVFFVSAAMVKHYENKYHINFESRYYIMPCYSIRTHATQSDPYKFINPTFTYIGSLAAWQNFNEMLTIFKAIQQRISCAELFIYTRDREKAQKIVTNANIKNCTVATVEPSELDEKLTHIKYGFLLRDTNVVNMVSTPTKMSDYLSNNVIPIYTSAVDFFSSLLDTTEYKICIDMNNVDKTIESIQHFQERSINETDLISNYDKIIDDFYSDEMHSINISQKLLVLLG